MRDARCALAAGVWVLLSLAAADAGAHGVGMSQLALRLDGTRVDGAWDLNLADARRAVGLDAAGGGEAAWGELRGREQALRRYLGGRLALAADGAACTLDVPAPLKWQPELGDPTRRRRWCSTAASRSAEAAA